MGTSSPLPGAGWVIETGTWSGPVPGAGFVIETQSIGVAQAISVTNTSETDSAQSITPVTAGATAILPATETDAAQAIPPVLGAVTLGIGAATEIATTQAITPMLGGVIITINAATEMGAAQSITLYVPGSLSQQDLDNIAAAVWAHADAVSVHSKLDAIITRITC